METQHHRARVFGLESVLNDLSPETSCRSELCCLFEEMIVSGEEEGKPACKLIYIHAGINSRFYVLDAVSQRERDFLSGGRTCLPNMIAADANCIPLGKLFRAIAEKGLGQSQRRSGREDISAPD